jgi:hypothetical protein
VIATLSPIEPPQTMRLDLVARNTSPTAPRAAPTASDDFWIRVSKSCQWRRLHKAVKGRRHLEPGATLIEAVEDTWPTSDWRGPFPYNDDIVLWAELSIRMHPDTKSSDLLWSEVAEVCQINYLRDAVEAVASRRPRGSASVICRAREKPVIIGEIVGAWVKLTKKFVTFFPYHDNFVVWAWLWHHGRPAAVAPRGKARPYGRITRFDKNFARRWERNQYRLDNYDNWGRWK